ncbi:MAG: sugar-binding protein [bacterium]
MNKSFKAFLIIVVFSALIGILSQDVFAGRIMWVWDKQGMVGQIIKSAGEQDKLFNFLSNPHGTKQKITTLYLETYRYFAKDSKVLAAFMAKAKAKGIDVYYLDGDPSWAVSYQEEAIGRANKVIAFNKANKVGFKGIIFDIEPYLLVTAELAGKGENGGVLEPYILPQWKTKRAEVEKKYLNLLKDIEKKVKSGKMEFGVAVPVLFGENLGRAKSLGDRILDIVDFMVVMDYRDVALRIIRDGKPFVDAAAKRGKKAIIGVETIDLVRLGEGDNASTFSEEGVKVMEGELAKVYRVLGKRKGFGGIAIHYYDSYKKLQLADRNKPLDNVPNIEARKIAPYKVDGTLSRWKDIPFIKINDRRNVIFQSERGWGGEKDISGEFAVAWAPGQIYLAARIKDNINVVSPGVRGMNIWKEDHIEVWLAPELTKPSGLNKDYQLGFSPGNFGNIKAFVSSWVPEYLSDARLVNVQVATKKTDDGYNFEAMIPSKVFDNFSPASGDTIRFTFDISDTDIAAAKQELLLSPTERVWGKSGTFSKLVFE